MDFVELNVKTREKIGKSSKQLKADGLVPAILYGGSEKPAPLQVSNREIVKLIHDGHRNAILMLKGLQKDSAAIIKSVQKEATKSRLSHIDFFRVEMNTEVETSLTLELVGEAEGVKLGGVLQQNFREFSIKSLPKDVPEKYELDISALEVGQSIKISDLKPIPGVEFLENADDVIVSVMAPTLQQEEEVVEEAEGAGEATEKEPEQKEENA